MADHTYYGSLPMPGRVWPGELVISGVEAPHELWEVDPTLPTLGMDPRIPNSDLIVIARGRILGIVSYGYGSASGASGYRKSRLTVCDGLNTTPFGFANNNIRQAHAHRMDMPPVANRFKVISVPFVEAVNNVYGVLNTGDKLMPYYGVSTSSTKNDNYVGRPVKWLERRVYGQPNPAVNAHHTRTNSYDAGFATATTSGFVLSGCSLYTNYGSASRMHYGIRPRVFAGFDPSGGLLICSGSTELAWNNPWWCIPTGNFRSAAGTEGDAIAGWLFDYGASTTQVFGEVVGIEVVNTTNKHEFSGWLKWATDNYIDFPEPIYTVPTNTTDVTNEDLTLSAVEGGYDTLAHYPVVPYKKVTVTITGSYKVFDADTGVTTTSSVTGEALPRSSDLLGDYTVSPFYNINERTGRIDFTNAVTLSDVGHATISYTYETDYADGKLFDGGQLGLTDGHHSGIPGTPENLEETSTVGELRITVY